MCAKKLDKIIFYPPKYQYADHCLLKNEYICKDKHIISTKKEKKTQIRYSLQKESIILIRRIYSPCTPTVNTPLLWGGKRETFSSMHTQMIDEQNKTSNNLLTILTISENKSQRYDNIFKNVQNILTPWFRRKCLFVILVYSDGWLTIFALFFFFSIL